MSVGREGVVVSVGREGVVMLVGRLEERLESVQFQCCPGAMLLSQSYLSSGSRASWCRLVESQLNVRVRRVWWGCCFVLVLCKISTSLATLDCISVGKEKLAHNSFKVRQGKELHGFVTHSPFYLQGFTMSSLPRKGPLVWMLVLRRR